ncbi:UNVERIFIED_CONTAM: hypothetical protein Sangu_3027400 [Sesamum angustifolium]|uniref:Uncharacterized protein n=1 Tax=Sesamum angustifolium TaxID=2727405 RepID=A0AAW2KMC7_9LAMI
MQSLAFRDCILDLASNDYSARYGHHKPCPVQSEYVVRTVDSKKGFARCQYMTTRFSRRFEMV